MRDSLLSCIANTVRVNARTHLLSHMPTRAWILLDLTKKKKKKIGFTMTENSGDTPSTNPDNFRSMLTFEERVAKLPDSIRDRFTDTTREIGKGIPRGPIPNVDGEADQLDVLTLVEDVWHHKALYDQGQGYKARDGRFQTWVGNNRVSPKSGQLAASIMGLEYSLHKRDSIEGKGDGYYFDHTFKGLQTSQA